MLVADVMRVDPQYLLSYQSCRVAARKMRDENVGFLPVCDGDRHVIGTITDRDIALRIVGEAKQYDLPVGDVMTRELVACHPGDELARAERLMAASRKSRIVVLDQRSLLVGVVSLSEIAKHDAANAGAVVARVAERELPRPAIRARPIASAPGARGPAASQAERAAADRAIRDTLHAALLAQETP